MSKTVAFARSTLQWALILAVSFAFVMGIGELVLFDISATMPGYTAADLILGWALLVICVGGWLEIQALRHRITTLESVNGRSEGERR